MLTDIKEMRCALTGFMQKGWIFVNQLFNMKMLLFKSVCMNVLVGLFDFSCILQCFLMGARG